jgi:hypothetical protein
MLINPSIFLSQAGGAVNAGKSRQDLSPEKIAGNNPLLSGVPEEEKPLWGLVDKLDYFSEGDSIGESNQEEIDERFHVNPDIDTSNYANSILVKVYTDATKTQTTQAFRDVVEIMQGLEQYGILNEDRYSEKEWENLVEKVQEEGAEFVYMDGSVVPRHEWVQQIAADIQSGGGTETPDRQEVWDVMKDKRWIDPVKLYEEGEAMGEDVGYTEQETRDIDELMLSIRRHDTMMLMLKNEHPESVCVVQQKAAPSLAALKKELYNKVYRIGDQPSPWQMSFLAPNRGGGEFMSTEQMRSMKRNLRRKWDAYKQKQDKQEAVAAERLRQEQVQREKQYIDRLYDAVMKKTEEENVDFLEEMASFSGKRILRT